MRQLTLAPVLTTERLMLRGPERGDLAAFTRFKTSAPSMIALGETVTPEQAWFGFLTGIGHWHWHGFGFFIVVERQFQVVESEHWRGSRCTGKREILPRNSFVLPVDKSRFCRRMVKR